MLGKKSSCVVLTFIIVFFFSYLEIVSFDLVLTERLKWVKCPSLETRSVMATCILISREGPGI